MVVHKYFTVGGHIQLVVLYFNIKHRHLIHAELFQIETV